MLRLQVQHRRSSSTPVSIHTISHIGLRNNASIIQNDIMASIREVGVFAWALAGINGSLEKYSRGKPKGESQPPGGLPVWSPGFQNGESPHMNGDGHYKSYNTNNNYNNSESNLHGQTWSNSTSIPRTSPYAQPQTQSQPHINGYPNGFGDPGLSRSLQNVWGPNGNSYNQARVGTNESMQLH